MKPGDRYWLATKPVTGPELHLVTVTDLHNRNDETWWVRSSEGGERVAQDKYLGTSPSDAVERHLDAVAAVGGGKRWNAENVRFAFRSKYPHLFATPDLPSDDDAMELPE